LTEWREPDQPDDWNVSDETRARAGDAVFRSGWSPDWLPLAAAVKGHDEGLVQARYEAECSNGPPWEALDEWQREAWRREVRNL
jgi:hypothetical protein